MSKQRRPTGKVHVCWDDVLVGAWWGARVAGEGGHGEDEGRECIRCAALASVERGVRIVQVWLQSVQQKNAEWKCSEPGQTHVLVLEDVTVSVTASAARRTHWCAA